MSEVDAVQARMAELARKFVARTLDDVAQMREALARMDGGSLELIRQLAHRACGTGGTLGLHRVSDACGDLERVIDAIPAGQVPDDATRTRMAAGIDDIATQLEMH